MKDNKLIIWGIALVVLSIIIQNGLLIDLIVAIRQSLFATATPGISGTMQTNWGLVLVLIIGGIMIFKGRKNGKTK